MKRIVGWPGLTVRPGVALLGGAEGAELYSALLLLLVVGRCFAGEPATTPAGQEAGDTPLVPPWFQGCLLYHHAFEGKPDEADVNPEQIALDLQARRGPVDETVKPVETVEKGLFGRGLHVRDGRAPFTLRSSAFSPHRPLTLSFWWALPYDLAIDGGYGLFDLTGRGYVGLFSRGKGEWCALQRPAGVFQVYYFPGIQNVNGIYDYDLLAHVDLRAGVWHHSAVVFRRATTAQVYTDGKRVFEVTISGREFTAADGLHNLAFGGPLFLDELMVLNRAVDADMISDYFRGVSQLREYCSPAGDG